MLYAHSHKVKMRSMLALAMTAFVNFRSFSLLASSCKHKTFLFMRSDISTMMRHTTYLTFHHLGK